MFLEHARAKLQLSAMPHNLPCREKEISDIKYFLADAIKHSKNGSLYISGVPGTGKTASTRFVIRAMQEKAKTGKLPRFDFVEINGMKLQRPNQVYSELLKGLTGEKASDSRAIKMLDDRFTKQANLKSAVVLLDELDYLVDRSQQVIYNLFDWPTKASSKLIVIGITNALDLPYGIMQKLSEIMRSRLKDADAISSDALDFCAKRIATVSGDVRRALEICRRATELAESDESTQVDVKHVEAAIEEIYKGTNLLMVRNLSAQEKLFLCIMAKETTRSGGEPVEFGVVCSAHLAILETQPWKHPGSLDLNICMISRICARLITCGLIKGDSAREDLHQRIQLATEVTPDHVQFALSGDPVGDKFYRAPA